MVSPLQLSRASAVNTADQIIIVSVANGDTRRLPIGELLRLFEQQFASPEMSTTLYTPGTGFNIAVPSTASLQQWILIQPAGTLAAGTVTLPLPSETADGSEIVVTTTQQITAFTLAPNGAAHVYGAPTTLGADDVFKMRYYLATNSWYRMV